MIIGNPIIVGGGGATASISVAGLSETDTVTATNGSKTKAGVWTQKPNPALVVLPAGYTQLEYIESTGTQYIDTSIKPTVNTDVTVDVKIKSIGTYCIFGSEKSDGTLSFKAYSLSSSNFRFGNTTVTNALSANTRYLMNMSKSGINVNGSNVPFSGYSFGSNSSYNLYLFANNKANSAIQLCTEAPMYSCKIKDNGVIVRDFVPAKRNSDNAIGMYDLVTNTFYGNAGTGTFTVGPEIPPTIDGFLIDKIKDYGTWTVTATDGTKTATQDVLVDVIAKYEIEMSLSA